MKKVLIITNLPWATPRVPGLSKYLPEFGWEAIILSPKLKTKPEVWLKVIETPYRDSLYWVKKLFKISPETDDIRQEIQEKFGRNYTNRILDFCLTRGGEIFNYPDSLKGWLPFGLESGRKILNEGNIAALLSCSSPVTAHIIARKLKNNGGVPWVADLRDLWSQNHNYSYSPLRRMIDRRLEVKTFSTADSLVTVSQPWANELRALHHGKTTYAITNGFDPETVNIPPAALTPKFTITYTGVIYAKKQDLTKLYNALRDLISEGSLNPDDIEVGFYGAETQWLSKISEEHGLANIVRQYGTVPQKAAFEKQKESQVLLLLNWEDRRVRGWHPLKGFGYLASGRPILATGGFGDDVTQKLLEETKAGFYCRTTDEIKIVIKKLYAEYKLTGKASYAGDWIKINKYSQRETAKAYAEILDNAAGGKG